MEMPTQQVIGQQYSNNIAIEESIKRYIDDSLGLALPFPVDRLIVTANRNEDEEISVSVGFPSMTGGVAEENIIDLTFQAREGYHAQLDYIFEPNIGVQTIIPQEVVEVIELTTGMIRVPISYEYSGQGAIRFYIRDEIPEITTETISFLTESGVYQYNLLDTVSATDIIIDSAEFLSSTDIIEPVQEDEEAIPQLISFEDGTPYIYTKIDTPEGIEIQMTVTYSNAKTYSENVDVVDDIADEYVFGMKLNREKYIALLTTPLEAGIYKAIYTANIYYPGECLQ